MFPRTFEPEAGIAKKMMLQKLNHITATPGTPGDLGASAGGWKCI
jgi:hypothetical protein